MECNNDKIIKNIKIIKLLMLYESSNQLGIALSKDYFEVNLVEINAFF